MDFEKLWYSVKGDLARKANYGPDGSVCDEAKTLLVYMTEKECEEMENVKSRKGECK